MLVRVRALSRWLLGLIPNGRSLTCSHPSARCPHYQLLLKDMYLTLKAALDQINPSISSLRNYFGLPSRLTKWKRIGLCWRSSSSLSLIGRRVSVLGSQYRQQYTGNNPYQMQTAMDCFEDVIRRFPKCAEGYALYAQVTLQRCAPLGTAHTGQRLSVCLRVLLFN